MNLTKKSIIGAVAFCSFTINSSIFAVEESGEWTNLFNGKDLQGWHANTGGQGDETSQKANEIFTVRDGVIHIYQNADAGSKQSNANLYHESTWGKFHLQVEYRWLEKKFQPRTEDNRDAGILFHIHTHPAGVWPPSVEMQLGDGKPGDKYVTGDLFVLGTTRADSPSDGGKYAEGGEMLTRGQDAKGRRTAVTSHVEKPVGEWNMAEVIVHGSEKAEFILNGKVLNTVYNMKFRDSNGEWKALEKGHISVQAEWAELEYRTIRIKELKE
ncbi:DUF1080 domain-containing protein [Luteolibacter algae]|uniref:DUF1080 domain-containing protein n=1 Tax=Luteolibacter algae TaxID=454151 RepID=A0ABW5DC78_9BACT